MNLEGRSVGLLKDPQVQRTGSVDTQEFGVLAPNRTLIFGILSCLWPDNRNVPQAGIGLLASVHPVCQSHGGLNLTYPDTSIDSSGVVVLIWGGFISGFKPSCPVLVVLRWEVRWVPCRGVAHCLYLS